MYTFCIRRSCVRWALYLFLPSSSLFAQQHYSLQQLIDAAGRNLPVIKQKQLLADAAKAGVTDVKHSFLPQVKLSDQLNMATDNSIAGTYLPLGTTLSSSAGVRASNNSSPATGNFGVLYGEYELVNFGLNAARLKNAEAYVVLQQADLEKERYLLQLAVAREYFSLLKTKYRLEADKQNVNRYDSIFKVIRVLAASGIKAGADSSLSKAELSGARIAYNQTVGNLNQVKVRLAYLTGIPVPTLNVDSLADFTSRQVPVLRFAADTVGNPLIDYYAKKNNLLITEQAVIRKSYAPKILLAGGGWMRGSSIQYNDDYKSLTTGLGYQRFNYAAGIAFTYNLFNGLYKKDKLNISHLQVLAGGYELQQQQLSLLLAADQADNTLQTNEANLIELPVRLQSAEDTYRQKLAQYKAGIISLIDLTNASFVLYRSQTDYIQAISDWYLARLDKAAAIGNLTRFTQTIK
ncbi:MAG: TolC family protein [Bacteroidota bacterium]